MYLNYYLPIKSSCWTFYLVLPCTPFYLALPIKVINNTQLQCLVSTGHIQMQLMTVLYNYSQLRRAVDMCTVHVHTILTFGAHNSYIFSMSTVTIKEPIPELGQLLKEE